MNQYEININHNDYYRALEVIRESGITNMYGAAPYLKLQYPELTLVEASDILCTWMHNYDKLQEQGIIIRNMEGEV